MIIDIHFMEENEERVLEVVVIRIILHSQLRLQTM
jgi:hypothetical protein